MMQDCAFDDEGSGSAGTPSGRWINVLVALAKAGKLDGKALVRAFGREGVPDELGQSQYFEMLMEVIGNGALTECLRRTPDDYLDIAFVVADLSSRDDRLLAERVVGSTAALPAFKVQADSEPQVAAVIMERPHAIARFRAIGMSSAAEFFEASDCALPMLAFSADGALAMSLDFGGDAGGESEGEGPVDDEAAGAA